MDDLQERYQFEDFPRDTLSKGITRRQLLTTLAAELHLLSKRKEGLAGIKLSNLGLLSDEDLKDFIPSIVKGIHPGCRQAGIPVSYRSCRDLHV